MDHNDVYKHFLELKKEQNNKLNKVYQEQFKCLKIVLDSIPSLWEDLKTAMTTKGSSSTSRDMASLGKLAVKMDIDDHDISLGINYVDFFDHVSAHLQSDDLYDMFFQYAEYHYDEITSSVTDAKSVTISPLNKGLKIHVGYRVSYFTTGK